MRSFYGIPQNIGTDVVGSVTNNKWNIGRNKILCSENSSLLESRFAASICCKSFFPTTTALIVSKMPEVNEGDVIRITNNGYATIVADRKSHSNAIIIQNKCNANCIMCPQTLDQKDVTWGEISSIIQAMPKTLQSLGITGGEPTLDRELMIKVLSLLKISLPNTHIDILTNGILLRDNDFVNSIVAVRHPSISFHIPLYSDVSEIHDKIIGAIGFYKTMEGLYNLASHNQYIEIRNVINKLTYSRLPNLARFIFHNLPFANHIALMGNEYCGMSDLNATELWIDPLDYQHELEDATQYLNGWGMNVSIYNHQLCTIDSSLWGYAKRSISEWKTVYYNECHLCSVQRQCGGGFSTSRHHISRGIQAITVK